MITGVWKGKIDRQKVEVKIILDGDSLRGTSYYYESATRYRRYSIRGFFDQNTNEAVWWDDQLIEERPASGSGRRMALLSRADFNCPGGDRMMLDGKTGPVDGAPRAEVHLDKAISGMFSDEWDYVLENFLAGANDPYIIDSIASLAINPRLEIPTPPVLSNQPASEILEIRQTQLPPASIPVITAIPATAIPMTIEQKFASRKKILTTEIPIAGDSIEIRFYDHGEVDGDSISLFLNDKLIYSHIRLTGNAYIVKIPVDELPSDSELTMVAENLGSIPPNTSYMVAIVNEKRYEARLESSEGSSAVVRFIR